MASSIASLVPEPMEKCAVALASPISTMLSCVQRSQRMVGKLRHIERLMMSLWPCEFLGEHAFQELRGLLFVELVDAGALEGLRIGFDHPGRAAGLVLIAVSDEDAVFGLA